MTRQLFLAVSILVVICLLLHEQRTAAYWRKQYDATAANYQWAEADRRKLLNEIVSDEREMPIDIYVTKTCLDNHNGESFPQPGPVQIEVRYTHSEPLRRVALGRCPKGTMDVNVYVGRK